MRFKFKITKKLLTKIGVFAAITLACTAMQGLCIFYLSALPFWVRIVAVALLTCCNICGVLFFYMGNKELFRLTLTVIITVAVLLTGFIILDETGFFETFNDFESIKNLILSTGKWGFVIYVTLIILQVVVIPIPSVAVELVAVALYGPLKAFILTTIGVLIGSEIAFLMGRIFGKKLVYWIAGKEKTDKYSEMFAERGRIIFIMAMIFPFFPDDIICMVAGLSGMPHLFFIIAVLLTRPIGIAATAFFGSGSIIPFSGWGIPVWIAVFALIIVTFILVTKFTNKKKRLPGGISSAVKISQLNTQEAEKKFFKRRRVKGGAVLSAKPESLKKTKAGDNISSKRVSNKHVQKQPPAK